MNKFSGVICSFDFFFVIYDTFIYLFILTNNIKKQERMVERKSRTVYWKKSALLST